MIELKIKRTINSKSYLLDDGKIKTEVYQYPLHFNDNKELKDIDTNIENEIGFGYKIKKANYNVRFFNKRLRFGFAKNVYIDYVLPSESAIVDGNKYTIENAWNNANLEYIMELNGVKNNIILKSTDCPNVFNFPVELSNCTVELADNSINIISNDNRIGIIPEPFMYDSNGNYGSVTIKHIDNIISFEADSNFLETASYPVTIDPSTFPFVDVDGYVYGTSINTSSISITVGRTYTDCNIFIKFNPVNLPQGSTITSAVLTYTSNENATGSNPITRIYGNNIDSATMPTSRANYDAKAVTTAYVDWTMPNTSNGVEFSSPDIKNVVQEIVSRSGWVSGNAMLLLHKDNGSASQNSRTVRAYEYSSANAPKLTITYATGNSYTMELSANVGAVGISYKATDKKVTNLLTAAASIIKLTNKPLTGLITRGTADIRSFLTNSADKFSN